MGYSVHVYYKADIDLFLLPLKRAQPAKGNPFGISLKLQCGKQNPAGKSRAHGLWHHGPLVTVPGEYRPLCRKTL
jgi:hypothetical protein